jgi:hypothetical protein
MEIPVGTVAMLALWPHKSPGARHADELAAFLASHSAEKWPPTVREVTAVHYVQRPDLISMAGPVLQWAEEEHDAGTLHAIREVGLTALKHGVLHHTGDSDPWMRSDVDLLSWTITALRHRGDHARLAEFHTPPEVADVLTRLSLGEHPPAEHSLYEGTGGTGGIFRAAAQHLRDCDVDPRRWTWHLEELDPISAAGAAVNFLIWDLGPHATVTCGDILSDGNLYAQAMAERTAAEAHRAELLEAAQTLIAQRRALRLLANLGVTAPPSERSGPAD